MLNTMTEAREVSRTGLTEPKLMLRIEGAAVLVGALLLYAYQGWDWLLFVLLLFAPDLYMVGYLANTRIGSVTYNLAHTYAVPIILMGLSVALPVGWLAQLAVIWAAHIGMDRMLGFGLKYATAFKDTHLQRV